MAEASSDGQSPEADQGTSTLGSRMDPGAESNNTNSGSANDGANSGSAPNGANLGFVPEAANSGSTSDSANAGPTPDGANSGSAPDDDGTNSGSATDGTNSGTAHGSANSGFVPEVANSGSTSDSANAGLTPDGANAGSAPDDDGTNSGSATDGTNSDTAHASANSGFVPEVANSGSTCDSANAGPTPDGANSGSAPDDDGINSGSATDGTISDTAHGSANSGFVPKVTILSSSTDSANAGSTPDGANADSAPEGANSGCATDGANLGCASENANAGSAPEGPNSGSGSNSTEPSSKSSSSGSGGVYRPPSMRARLRKQDGGPSFPVYPDLMNASIPTVPTFEQYLLQQVKEKKTVGPFAKYNVPQNTPRTVFDKNTPRTVFEKNTPRTEGMRNNQRFNRNEFPQRRHQNTFVRYMSCSMLAEIACSESVVIIEKINRQKESFKKLLETTPDERSQDVFALVFELVTNVWKSSFEESKKLLLLEICNSKFIDHLQLYLMQLPYTEDSREKSFNKHYWTKEKEFWSNFMTFCECVINVSPSTAVRKCGALIEATSKSCLDGLKEKHDFELPVEYITRMTNLRDGLKKQAQSHKKSNTRAIDEPLESFRELSVLPTGSELLERRPFLRPNVVEGAYSDVEHYLDVQFRLLREDCFGPLREGIYQYIEAPKQRKYDHIRVYRNVQFLEPYFTKQKFGSLVLLDHYTEKMFKKINWKQSKRFLFGSLVLFTKDNCQSFLVGTILERDEEFLSKRMLGVSIIDSTMESDLYNGDLYTMIECDVYFEPYHHVLKALQDPSFPEHLAMSKYIVDVQKVPENPAYLTPHTVYAVKTKNGEDESEFSVLQDKTWPSETELGLDSTQYEAYKLALSNEFAVIQGPPGTGKTFLGVKIAKTLLENAPFSSCTCSMLVICYTNHALDQFLEALLPITESIVRIGGRSQSQLLEKYNISNLRNRSCYDERFYLEDSIRELKHFHEACVSNEILLSYDTIVAFAKECDLIYKLYNKNRRQYYTDTDSDALRRWLFEDVDSVEYVHLPFLEDNIQNKENEKVHENKKENKDVDNDIYARDDFVIDDNKEINEELQNSRRLCSRILVSFSLSDAEGEMKRFVEKYHSAKNAQQNLKEQDPHYDDDYYDRILQDLESRIIEQHSKIKVFKEMMLYQTRAPRIKLTDVKDLSTVPRIERWSYYFKWANIAKTHLKAEVKKREEKVKSAAEVYEEARMMVDRLVLKRSTVVGMTTSAAARLRKLLVEVAPPIVVVEEAAEVLEAHIVTSLTKSCQHLILIGDHQQLRPSAACVRLARHYQLEVSLFERMIRNGVHSRRLGVQHRMRPEIAALVAPSIYPDLRNHRSVEDFPPVRGVAHNLFFFSHDYMEQNEDDNSSRTNTLEADFTLRLANYLMQQGYKPHEVTIVATYSGQMFYMRRQRSLYDHLSDVKITVLDNYQGEESRIILLSLVRNNSNDSIGFLGTENRICVALSRAREGFFIFGNMELLKRNSTLWTNIAQTLADNGSLGSTLKLKCENHDGQITAITSLEDFVKVPEGGCLLDCKFNLPSCGHPCPRMCHAYDLAHSTIHCTRDCERKICDIEGHNCPLGCARKCRPCERYVNKVLPCGHTRAIPCHMAPDDPAAYCAEEVDVTLPGCGHKATKPCSKRISDVECVEKCESGRLSCGHACIRRCHVNDDPEHERYTCKKPCPRPKKRCTTNLEGDFGDHKCPLSCWEACPPCDVLVTKKRSGCKHSKRMACREDVDAEPCREKCARSLPCGHHCKKLCFEKCGDCKQKVKKTVPGCDHEIEIECGTDLSREHCTQKCERTMTCGHACPGRCAQPCDPTACTKITEHSSEAPCGHSVRLPCNVYQLVQNGSVSDAALLASCTAPCGVLLRCGHSCSGSCAGCRQGRLHQPCAARCHQLNICGHRCSEPCNQVCPPCRRRCAVSCPHSSCGKLCGAPCTPCTEAECGRACEHEACKRACGAPCDRAPCERKCPRALGCGHPCRGLCGEPCPPVCRLCDPDNFPTDLLGDPYDDDVKLIQLQDCPHILDVDTLDTLMKSQNETIQIKTCPFCREPIINTYRYKDLVNKMLRDDINPIKEKVYGTEHQRSKMRVELFKKIMDLKENQKLTKENKYWKTAYEALRSVVKEKNKDVSVLHLDMYHIYLDLLVTVREYCKKYVAENLTELKTEMREQVKFICEALVASKQKISQQQQADMGQELKRMNSIVQLSKILGLSKYAANPDVQEMAKTATEAVLTWRIYDEEKGVECLKKLEEAVKLSGIASKVERDMVVRAIGLKAGHWYKCPNGHFYCIGDCGGAMQLARCNECGAAIGGTKHTLTAGNQHAGEMDGSRFAAWSQEANNMANFQLD